MKGIVFTELIEMVEDKWGLAMADRLLQPEGLASKGIFTAVGTYEDRDLFTIIGRLSEATGLSPDELQFHFGGYLFGSFVRGYSEMLSSFETTFDLLSRLDDFIHPEVQRLYPDATLPSFSVMNRTETLLEMNYSSQRKMPEFAVGLTQAAAKHFGETLSVKWEALNEEEGLFRFVVTKES